MTKREQRTFTDAFIESLKPKAAPYKRSETARRGEGRLIVRVLPKRKGQPVVKEFFYRYRPNGRDSMLALGRYDPKGENGGKTLKQINRLLNEKRTLQDTHGDVKAYELAKARQDALEARKGSFRQLLDAYVKSLEDAGKPSARQVKTLFKLHVLDPFPELAKASANEILPDDIQAILARMVKAGITRQVNVARSYLAAAFSFGAKADNDPRTLARDGVLFGLKSNPVSVVPRIAAYENTRERTLSEVELGACWKALDALPLVQRATIRLNLALACQRPKQLLRADWSSFDLEANTLLIRDAKGRGGSRDHLLPLTAFALEQLKPLRELNSTPDKDGKMPLPFSSDGKRPLALETLSKAVSEVSRELHKAEKIPAFQLRDLRRTAETMLQQLGVDREVRAHLLSHGRTSGVQGKHYERYDFLPEKRKALEKWARHLRAIIEGKPAAKVVKLRA